LRSTFSFPMRQGGRQILSAAHLMAVAPSFARTFGDCGL
jgi:hypothetical protein